MVRTFTVLIQWEADPITQPTQEQSVQMLREELQHVYDGEEADLGDGNFLVVGVEDGDDRFWREWHLRNRHEPKLMIASDGVFTHEREYDPVEEAIDAVGHALALKSENPDATITLVVV